MAVVQLKGYRCERCAHPWVPRMLRHPRICPKCKSPYWDVPRKKSRTTPAHSRIRYGVTS